MKQTEDNAKIEEIERKAKISRAKTQLDMPRDKPFFEMHDGGILSSDGQTLYFVGIIDILTNYGAKKKLEYAFKSIRYGKKVSCIPPM